MAKKSIVIADDNFELADSLKRFFENDSHFEVTAVCRDGLEAVSVIEHKCPDFVILDIVMPELDGFGVLSQLNFCNLSKSPVIIMSSQLSGDGFVTKAMRLGASYFLAKPFGHAMLRDCLLGFCSETSAASTFSEEGILARHEANSRSLDEKIANIFIAVGIPAHIKGYQFLREAVKVTVLDPPVINSITKVLYPSIAERYSTSPSKVERAIRHAIEVAWCRGKLENINDIFGFPVYSANEKPTNGEFIALVADKMLTSGH